VIDALHYIFVVSDGRTNQSEGLTLYELSEVMRQYGCITAYNLDGGGSSTMVFAGEVINIPTTNGKMITERAVSDIVYISA
jgi:exopolysaccharide biosynthesis protein